MSWINNINPLRRLSYKQRSLMTLASSFFIHVSIGAFYVWGGIITYIASSVRQSDGNFTKQDVGLLSPFLTLFIMFGSPVGHIISRQKSPRPFLFIFSAALGGIFIISSYLVKKFFWFVFFYGALFGLFTGFIYMVPFISCFEYFPQKKALISGIISSGSALGSIILLLLMFWLINPNNKKPTELFDGKNYYYDEEIQNNIPPAIRTLGIIITTTLFICTIFHEKLDQTTQQQSSSVNTISQDCTPQQQKPQTEENTIPMIQATSNESPLTQNKPNDHVVTETEMAGQPVEDKPRHTNDDIEKNDNNIHSDSEPHPSNNNDEKNYVLGELETLSEGLKTKFIYLTIFFAMSLTVYGSFISSNYKTLSETYHYKDSSGTIIGVVGSLMNAVSRIFWGWLFQRYSFKDLAQASFIMQLIFSLTYMWTAQIEILFVLQSIMAFFSFGGWLAILPALVVKIYGNKIGALIYSVTFIGFSISAFTATSLLLLTKEVLELKNVFSIIGLIQLLGLIVVQKYGYHEKYTKKIMIQRGDGQTSKGD